MDVSRLRSLGASLVEDSPITVRLGSYLTGARSFLEEMRPRALARAAFPRETADFLEDAASGHQHLGFLVPDAPANETVFGVARQVGFAHRQVSFPSAFVARELGALAGVPEVPTRVAKGSLEPTAMTTVEVFVPSYDGAVVRDWIRRGAVTHLGLGLKDPAAVERAHRMCVAAGLALVADMRDAPLRNAAGDVFFYVDTATPAGRLRVELHHYVWQSARAPG